MIEKILSVGCVLLLMSVCAKSEHPTSQIQEINVSKADWHELSDFRKTM